MRGTKDGGKSYSNITDTGFITSLPNDDPMFKGLESELKSLFPDQSLTGGKGSGSISFKKKPGFDYIIDVVAPFGGTLWGSTLNCGEMKTDQTKPQTDQNKPQGEKLVDGYHKTYDNDKNILKDGKFKGGELWEGNHYIYDENDLLERIEIWENGKYSGRNGKIS